MPELILYIGRIGSGKTTHYEQNFSDTHVHISQDLQGKNRHKEIFEQAVADQKDLVIDRQNHIRDQRDYYLNLAKKNGYMTKIIEFKVNRNLCEYRVANRKDHPTINNKSPIEAILRQYERQYQGVLAYEADEYEVIRQHYDAPVKDLTHLKGRILVIGDPHGCFDEIKYAIDEHKPDHTIFLGDLGDRGLKIREVFEYVKNTPNTYTVLGNHDHKLLRALRGNKVSTEGGLDQTLAQLASYSEQDRKDLYDWLIAQPLIIKLPKNYVAAHAGLDPTRPLERQRYEVPMYIRTFGGKKMNDDDYPRWYSLEPCDQLKQYHVLFGHAIHSEAKVSDWATALDMGAVYGTGLRVMVLDTEGEDTIHEYTTPMYYQSEIPDRHPFYKKEKLVKKKLLSKSEYQDLVLYNYTDRCVYEKSWVPETLKSRGTIYNKNTAEVVAQSFCKFFNVNETEETRIDRLPWDKPFQVFEKADGSLGALFRHEGEYKIATRGSFFSDQAKKATQMLKEHDLTGLPDEATLLFEIIYPENKIIVDYGKQEKLVLLAAFNRKNGKEYSWSQVEQFAKQFKFELPKVYDYTLEGLLRLKEEIKWDEDEGWIVRFENGVRVKIKGTKYLEMAKILAHMSPLSIWETMVEDRVQDYLISVPEEIRDQAEEIHDTLKKQFNNLKKKCDLKALELNLSDVNKNDIEERKQIALTIQKQPKWMQGYLLKVMAKKNGDRMLLKMIRPVGNTYVDLHEVIK